MKEKVEQIVIIVAATVGIFISLADMFGLFEYPPLTQRIPHITLLVSGLIVLYLVTETRGKISNIEKEVVEGEKRIIASVLEGVEVLELRNSAEVFDYYRKRIAQAKKCVDDLTWGHFPPHRNRTEQRAFENYMNEILNVTAEGEGNIVYREVMTFPYWKRIERAEAMIARNLPRYHLRYYDVPATGMPPLMQFFLIDCEEVILAFYHSPDVNFPEEVHLSVKHPLIVKLFQGYYEKIWHSAKILKEYGYINKSELKRIRQHLIENNLGPSEQKPADATEEPSLPNNLRS